MLSVVLIAAMNSREGSDMFVDVTTFAPTAVWVVLHLNGVDCTSLRHACLG